MRDWNRERALERTAIHYVDANLFQIRDDAALRAIGDQVARYRSDDINGHVAVLLIEEALGRVGIRIMKNPPPPEWQGT